MGTVAAHAVDGTWVGPFMEWTTGTNWSSTPTVPDNTATFANNGAPNELTIAAPVSINTINFTAGAPIYGFTTFGAGSLTINGAGIINQSSQIPVFDNINLTFNNSSTAANVLILNGFNNALKFNNTSTAGSAIIVNNFNGTTVFGLFNSSDTATAGHATIFNNSGGTTIFQGQSSAGNATIITNSGGETLFFDLSTGGNAQFFTANGGVVDFFMTNGPDHDHHFSAGSIAGSGVYYLGGGTLTVGSNNLSTAVSGEIMDSSGGATGASLVKVGTGTLTLSGSNAYTGTTTVNGGVLEVDGTIAPSIMTTANAHAALIGTGVVGNAQINAGGILAAGDAVPGASMVVKGNLSLQSGAFYQVGLNPTTSSFANVTGTATLGGSTVNAFYANGSYVSKQYTILNAANVSGTFGSLVNSNLPANFATSLSYDQTHAFLNLSLNFIGSTPGLNANQQNVANTLTNFFSSTGGIPMAFGSLTPAGLTQVSGETATGSQQTTFNAMTQFMGVMMDPFIAGRGDGFGGGSGTTGYADEEALAYAQKRNPNDALGAIYTKVRPVQTFEQRWSVWVAGFGGSQTTSGNAVVGSNNTNSSIAATAVGADYRISPFTIAGFSLAGGGTGFSVANSGSGHSDMFQAGVFIRHTVGAAYISGALAYGWQDFTTNRTVTAAGIDQLQARFNANTYSGRVEGGYRLVAPWGGGVGITPYAAGQFTTIDLPAYAERAVIGTNNFALAYGAKSVTDPRSELGFRTDKSFAVSDGILTLRGRVAWAHDYDTDRAIGATFQTLPGASFTVNGAAQASDSVLTTAAIEKKWMNGWSAAATFEGEFSNVTSSYAGKGVVRYVW